MIIGMMISAAFSPLIEPDEIVWVTGIYGDRYVPIYYLEHEAYCTDTTGCYSHRNDWIVIDKGEADSYSRQGCNTRAHEILHAKGYQHIDGTDPDRPHMIECPYPIKPVLEEPKVMETVPLTRPSLGGLHCEKGICKTPYAWKNQNAPADTSYSYAWAWTEREGTFKVYYLIGDELFKMPEGYETGCPRELTGCHFVEHGVHYVHLRDNAFDWIPAGCSPYDHEMLHAWGYNEEMISDFFSCYPKDHPLYTESKYTTLPVIGFRK